MASIDLNVGTSANANDGDTLRAAFIKVRKMFAEVYGQTYVSDTDPITPSAFKIKANKLQMTTDAVAGDDGKVLTYDHASGSFTWETKFDGDITEIVAGNGLTGDATSGTSSLAVGAGDGIAVSADAVSLDTSVAGSGLTLTSGVLSVDEIGTDGISNDAVSGAKLAQFDDSLTASTSGDIIVSNGTDFIQATMSGDATIASGGAITIVDNAITQSMLNDDIVTNAELGAEYTASVALTSGAAVSVDTSLGNVFTMTAGASHTFNFTNVVIGDMKSLEITGSGGSFTSAFGTVNGSACTFNKIGGTYSDTAAKQLIQIKWTATNVAWYQISPIAS